MRFKRLWLPLAVATTAALLIRLVGTNDPRYFLTIYVLALAFLPTPEGVFRLNGPAWSLFFELVANIVHASILSRLHTIALAAISCVCAAILIHHGSLDGTGQKQLLWLGVPRVLMSYCLGIIVWRLNGDTGRIPFYLGVIGLPLAIGLIGRFEFLFVAISPVFILSALSYHGNAFAWRLTGALSYPLYVSHIVVRDISAALGWSFLLTFIAALAWAWTVGMIADPRVRKLFNRKTASPSTKDHLTVP